MRKKKSVDVVKTGPEKLGKDEESSQGLRKFAKIQKGDKAYETAKDLRK